MEAIDGRVNGQAIADWWGSAAFERPKNWTYYDKGRTDHSSHHRNGRLAPTNWLLLLVKTLRVLIHSYIVYSVGQELVGPGHTEEGGAAGGITGSTGTEYSCAG